MRWAKAVAVVIIVVVGVVAVSAVVAAGHGWPHAPLLAAGYVAGVAFMMAGQK